MARVRLGKYEIEQHRLPQVCMRCGAASTYRKVKHFNWFPWWILLLSPFGVLPFLILLAVLTRRMTVPISLCQRHRWHFTWRQWVNYLLLFAWLAGIVLVVKTFRDWPETTYSTILTITILGGLLIWVILIMVLHLTSIRPAQITDRHIILAGVSEAFIAALDQDRCAGEDDFDDPSGPIHQGDQDTYSARQPP